MHGDDQDIENAPLRARQEHGGGHLLGLAAARHRALDDGACTGICQYGVDDEVGEAE
jgi:hypothetical protein